MKRTLFGGLMLAAAGVLGAGVFAPAAQADQVAYLVNVHVRPGYNFPNAEAALGYGYSLCDRMAAGEGYPSLMGVVKNDFNTNDEQQANYLILQAAQELCPAQIWALRNSAAGYRPPPGANF
jgi:Protein of unknown function (DUF732)